MLLTVLSAGVIAAVAFVFWSRRHAAPAGLVTGPGPLSTVLLPAVAIIEVPAAPVPPAPARAAQVPPAPARAAQVPPAPAPPVPRAESTEGLLVVQLLRGELTGAQYREAMACLAARDEARNPMPTPGEIGPASE
ncbi:hypothetical protein [Actinoplanes teichomyceticus]|uniref:Uncharacterized protein n=2 Tax=Actinoplanes teichomyceticus TaxID=1867 RepID=A0A561WM28_ACTTI|nr:hypothetical protein [Actinoplanes teichomyceticus]TWG24890.1 hypothetical protein FHX34_1021453 [Actinoplanes teichomyceticus]GIF15574.1 hypothetical protein Ate01nite_56060 [Actinoplanes teichomyceticus]